MFIRKHATNSINGNARCGVQVAPGTRRGWRVIAIGCGFAATVAAGNASAADFRNALETALTNNPDLQGQYEVLRGLNENVSQARAGLRPSISGSGSAALSYTDSSESVRKNRNRPASVSLTVTQPLFDGFQTQRGVDSAIASVQSGRQTLRQTEQTVLLNAIIAYIGVVQARENVSLARNDLKVSEGSLQAARDRLNVGEVTRTDVAQAEAALAESKANLASQRGALSQSRETYLRQVGVWPEELRPLPHLPNLPKTLSEAREIARRNHPSILAARAAVESAGHFVEQARGALLPQVELQATGTTGSDTTNRGSGVMTGSASVNVTVPIYQSGLLRSNIRRNQALESQRFQELRAVTRQVLESTGVAWENLQTSAATIRANLTAVRSNEIALEGVRQEAKVGSRTTLNILEAQQRLLNSQVALVNARTNRQINAYTLLSAMGVLSIETLGLNVRRPDLDEEFDAVTGPLSGTYEDVERKPDWLTNSKH